MGLREKLRDIEQRSTQSARKGLDRAKEEWADAERRLRQKMRIYPQRVARLKKAQGEETQTGAVRLPVGGRAAEQLHDPESPGAPIVTIHERDLEIEIEDEMEDNGCGHLTQPR